MAPWSVSPPAPVRTHGTGGVRGSQDPWTQQRGSAADDACVDHPTIAMGNAVLSRRPIAEQDVVQLPAGPGEDDGRLALYARLDGPSHPVPFFTTHLTSTVDASAVRCEQVAVLAEFVAAHHRHRLPASDHGGLPRMAGLRRSPVVRRLQHGTRRPRPGLPRRLGARRPPAALGDLGHGQRVHRGRLRASVRVDYLHVAPPGPEWLGYVDAIRRVADRAVNGVWPSDHAPVHAELRSGAGSAGA
jgi:endonuclease/exonuclease/phosphatase family metal-dependent hydrolase